MSQAACEVWFYHLERSALDQVLPELLEKTLSRGWRALVRTAERERVEHLDGWLWAYREDSFLPHGTDDEPMADRQPILLTTAARNANDAQALFLIDGAEPGDISPYARCILLFDGRDEAALAAARQRWSAFKAAGHPVSYWQQGESRGWEKKA
ncbi:MAG TPA: DNA polymerase III subunit chi [Caulobacteraceae bacterium]|jgi:DNA polymerase-3 subunit chi|nr:DNA polymerase III subunit chi [Caulobacteraceae bacterium]